MKSSFFVLISRAGIVGLAIGGLAACAQGNDVDTSDTGGEDGDSSSSSTDGVGSGAGPGTTGPGSTSAASTGAGPGSSSSSSSDGGAGVGGGSGPSGSGGGATGGSGGGGGGLEGTASTMLSVFAGSFSSAIVGNSQNFVTNMGWATPFTEQTGERVALAMTGNGKGIAVVRATGTGELRYAVWSGMWFPGFGSPLTPVEADLTVVGGPAIASAGLDKADVVYQRDDTKFYYAAIQSGLWSPKQEPVGNGADQSSGPVPPAVAVIGGNAVAIFVGDDGDLYDRTRSAGTWQPANGHGLTGAVASITPAVVPLASGPELLVVFADATTHALEFTTFDGASWSAPEAIPNAVSDEAVSLAALPSSGAAIAYRATDGTPHTVVFSPTDVPAWSEPPGLPATQLVSAPAIAAGALGARAELMYVDTAFIAYSSRLLMNGAWTAPAVSGSSGERIALATGL